MTPDRHQHLPISLIPRPGHHFGSAPAQRVAQRGDAHPRQPDATHAPHHPTSSRGAALVHAVGARPEPHVGHVGSPHSRHPHHHASILHALGHLEHSVAHRAERDAHALQQAAATAYHAARWAATHPGDVALGLNTAAIATAWIPGVDVASAALATTADVASLSAASVALVRRDWTNAIMLGTPTLATIKIGRELDEAERRALQMAHRESAALSRLARRIRVTPGRQLSQWERTEIAKRIARLREYRMAADYISHLRAQAQVTLLGLDWTVDVAHHSWLS